jgi:hypothetical protein
MVASQKAAEKAKKQVASPHPELSPLPASLLVTLTACAAVRSHVIALNRVTLAVDPQGSSELRQSSAFVFEWRFREHQREESEKAIGELAS